MKTTPLALALLAGAVPAFATAIRIPNHDARGIARGNAFAATADNASAIYYNPAGIAFLEGTQLRATSYVVLFDVDYHGAAGADSSIDERLQGVAQLYLTSTPAGRPFAWGLGLYTPYGLGDTWPDDAPFRALGTKAELIYVALNPVVAWRPHPTISLAAGPSLDFGKIQLRQGIGPQPDDQLNFSGFDVNPTVTAGLMWRPHTRHSVGISYRGPGEMTFDGEAETAFGGLRVEQDATYHVSLPQHVIVGYSFRPTPAWNFEVNVDWTDWNVVDNATFGMPSGDAPVIFDWQSGFLYEFGATRTLRDGLEVSAGYWYSEETVPDARYKPIVPDLALHVFSAGLGWIWGAWNLEAVYQLGYGPTRTVTGSEGGLADGDYDYLSHAFSLAAGRRF